MPKSRTHDAPEPIVLGPESVPFLLVLEEVAAENAAREARDSNGAPNDPR
jgi:hypothetical protein